MTIASFVFSAVALALSGAAFGWQILSWFMTGGRVKVELRIGASNASGIVSSAPHELGRGWYDRFANQGYTRPVVVANVHNAGRLPVYVNSWGIKNDKVSFRPVADSEGPDLPHKLEPGQEATWTMSLEAIESMAKTRHIVSARDRINAFVRLGTGKEILSRNTTTSAVLSIARGD